MMIMMMCGVTFKTNVGGLGIDSVLNVMRISRLRWFGHVERMPAEDWVSRCRRLVVDGTSGRGRGRKTWSECLMEGMRVVELKAVDAQDRSVWKAGIMRKPSDLR